MKNKKAIVIAHLACALLFSLLIFTFSFVGCDLINPLPETDLEKKIDDQVKWAKAARLTVTVAYPLDWGTSPQQGTGKCGDVRLGFAFEIEFEPDIKYSLVEWRAYPSPLPDGWVSDTSLLGNLERLDGRSVTVPTLPSRGGTGSFIINTATPLFPFARPSPMLPEPSPEMAPRRRIHASQKLLFISTRH